MDEIHCVFRSAKYYDSVAYKSWRNELRFNFIFQLGMMSPRSLKAAGMTMIREASTPISVVTNPVTTHTTMDSHIVTSTPVSKSSYSPPNNNSLLDISLLSGKGSH